jgi:large subunit ribosomal protein L10
LAEYRSLPVGNMTELRKRARNSGVYLRVLKNTWRAAPLPIRRSRV